MYRIRRLQAKTGTHTRTISTGNQRWGRYVRHPLSAISITSKHPYNKLRSHDLVTNYIQHWCCTPPRWEWSSHYHICLVLSRIFQMASMRTVHPHTHCSHEKKVWSTLIWSLSHVCSINAGSNRMLQSSSHKKSKCFPPLVDRRMWNCLKENNTDVYQTIHMPKILKPAHWIGSANITPTH